MGRIAAGHTVVDHTAVVHMADRTDAVHTGTDRTGTERSEADHTDRMEPSMAPRHMTAAVKDTDIEESESAHTHIGVAAGRTEPDHTAVSGRTIVPDRTASAGHTAASDKTVQPADRRTDTDRSAIGTGHSPVAQMSLVFRIPSAGRIADRRMIPIHRNDSVPQRNRVRGNDSIQAVVTSYCSSVRDFIEEH